MDIFKTAVDLMLAERDRLLGKPVFTSVDVLPTVHRDLPQGTHADPDMDTEELCCIAELQLAKLAKALGHDWYLVLGDVQCLVERARALGIEKEQGFF